MRKKENSPFEGLEGLTAMDFGIVQNESKTIEQKLLETMNKAGIKVQSVVLPPNFIVLRNQDMVLEWMRTNIKSVHSSFYFHSLKYKNN